jgi:ABC-type amino acid transport substrate-binding protein
LPQHLPPIAASLLTLWAAPAVARDLPAVKCSGRLVVAAAHEVPFETDLLRGFARSVGAEVQLLVVETPEAALKAVDAGQADLLAGGVLTRPSPGLAFSEEVFPSRIVIVNRRPAAAVQFVEQLRNERVAAARDTPALETLANAKVPRVDGARPVGGALAAPRAADPELQLGTFVGPRQSVVFAARSADADRLVSLNGHVRARRTGAFWPGSHRCYG